ncbi:MAG: hypothetical protein M1464_03390, partial [Candidatus Thermoplasmatota archaeon]|nr:hypothetical protein [Candidatus Thermoplasmatota archaeon]
TPINNPTLSFLTNGSTGLIIPGWAWSSSLKGNFPLSINRGIVMVANTTTQSGPAYESLSSNINYTYLVQHNYSLNLSSSVIQGKVAVNTTAPWQSFYGAVVTLNAQYNFYIVYNNTSKDLLTNTEHLTSFVYRTNVTSINFSALNSLILNNTSIVTIGPVQQATLSYVLNYGNQGKVMVEIANLSLNGGS